MMAYRDTLNVVIACKIGRQETEVEVWLLHDAKVDRIDVAGVLIQTQLQRHISVICNQNEYFWYLFALNLCE